MRPSPATPSERSSNFLTTSERSKEFCNIWTFANFFLQAWANHFLSETNAADNDARLWRHQVQQAVTGLCDEMFL